MYQTILFDLDGTLTDPKEGITKCVQYGLQHFGIDQPDLEQLTVFIGPPLMDGFQQYYHFTEEQASIATQKYRERFKNQGIFENKLYDGIPELLQHLLNKGKTLAIATSKPQIFTEQILDHFDLTKYFSVIVGSTLDGTLSKKEDVIQETLKQLQLNPEQFKQAIMVGDRCYDILGAQKCGLNSIGVGYGYAQPGELSQAGATYQVETILELQELLDQI
ncbi:HAD family hydrolase [Clostridium facile]|uniref:HAD family hydrolase n=1 Tax=Clostridium facile TaxID=2763035 RepID=A0ABR7ISR2_9CLOT|nr:HAD family hydrolase [Clostridium facile]MBC5787857.1 HAD family hydrolase [Clostridium facile]